MRELSDILKLAVDGMFASAARRRKRTLGQATCGLFLQTLVAGDTTLPRRWVIIIGVRWLLNIVLISDRVANFFMS